MLLVESKSHWDFCSFRHGVVSYLLQRGRHGFDGSCRGSKACRAPPARNRVEQHNWQLTVGTRSLNKIRQRVSPGVTYAFGMRRHTVGWPSRFGP